MIRKVLVANRGEIAVRVFQTLVEMGIHSVAVYSDPDAHALHVSTAEEAYPLQGQTASETYLNMEKILQAAAACGADAIHPGYGFLSENAAFADACALAGLCFIGPSAETIRRMGDKLESKRLMASAGVPTVPARAITDGSSKEVARLAEELGYPLLIKAAAGGGGKGMRLVRQSQELPPALEGARRETLKAFGNDRVFLEKYIDHPRHVEFQIMADGHGHVLHLFERECSIQRRHQKIIEETPCLALTPELRARMGQAATAAARAAAYQNAGTVEFLLAPDGAFYFLEMNTRLQVEHAITEMVTGQDLVREQIRVAQGEALSITAETLRQTGHAIECRIYAEDPAQQFLPVGGRIDVYEPARGPGLRIDSGVQRGSEVSIYYDPLLAKLIAWAPHRAAALARMRRALSQLVILGLTTNIPFLRRVIDHPAFAQGDLHTHFLQVHPDLLSAAAPAADAEVAATIASLILQRDGNPIGRGKDPRSTLTRGPWKEMGPWSNA